MVDPLRQRPLARSCCFRQAGRQAGRQADRQRKLVSVRGWGWEKAKPHHIYFGLNGAVIANLECLDVENNVGLALTKKSHTVWSSEG